MNLCDHWEVLTKNNDKNGYYFLIVLALYMGNSSICPFLVSKCVLKTLLPSMAPVNLKTLHQQSVLTTTQIRLHCPAARTRLQTEFRR